MQAFLNESYLWRLERGMHLQTFSYSVRTWFEFVLVVSGQDAYGVEAKLLEAAALRFWCNGACCGQTLMFGNGHQIDLEVPTFFPEADRVIAIGDVHGDVDALVGCLKVSCIDPSSHRCHVVNGRGA